MKRTCRLFAKLDPKLCRVYLVTDDTFRDGLLERVQGCIDGGVKLVQVRLKNVNNDDYTSVVREVVAYGRPRGVTVLVDDNVRVCLDAGADGVHVGKGDIPAAEARKLLGPERILGVTVYGSTENMMSAIEAGADYIGTGAMFPTSTKQAPVKGLQSIAPLRQALTQHQERHPIDLPIVAIGGITPSNAPQCIAAGADIVAMVSGLIGTPQPYYENCKERALETWRQLSARGV